MLRVLIIPSIDVPSVLCEDVLDYVFSELTKGMKNDSLIRCMITIGPCMPMVSV